MAAMASLEAVAQSEVAFSVDPVEMKAGESATVSIGLNNSSVSVASAVFAIRLPQGFSLVENPGSSTASYVSLSDRQTEGFIAYDNYDAADNTLYVVINGMGQTFSGTSGTIATIQLASPSALTSSLSSTLTLTNLSWSNADGIRGGNIDVDVNADVDVDVTVKGDANGDGSVNVFDIVAIADRILSGSEYDADVDANADINNDGEINVFDIVGVADVILNGGN